MRMSILNFGVKYDDGYGYFLLALKHWALVAKSRERNSVTYVFTDTPDDPQKEC